MDNITILYLTDNSLEPFLLRKCQEKLLQAIDRQTLISVSQEPLDFGENVCVGKIGRTGLNIDIQMKAGLERVKTPFVAIAEHDCIYSKEHFQFRPPDKKHFWYNDNCWLVQYKNVKYPQYDGMYSYIKARRVQSQLICGTDSLREATEKKLVILQDPYWQEKYPTGRVGEPGTNHLERSRMIVKGSVKHLWDKMKQYIISYNAQDFKTVTANLDIRHGNNFTGQRRGSKRTFNLSPWGTLQDVLEN